MPWGLRAADFAKRLASEATGEWTYVFKPIVGGIVVYVKLILRRGCVVVSFLEDEGGDEEDARLLRLGANTLSRWEAGRNVQTEAMDTPLRLIRDLPGTIEYLRAHAA